MLEERLDDRGQEFPRIDERLTGRRHRYGYAVGVGTSADATSTLADALLKHDLVAGGTARRARSARAPAWASSCSCPRGPTPPRTTVWLMGFVHHGTEDRTDLAVLDAATLETVATVHLPARVPYGFDRRQIWHPRGPVLPADVVDVEDVLGDARRSSTEVNPAARNISLAFCSPHIVPRPAPSSASDTVMQWNVDTE